MKRTDFWTHQHVIAFMLYICFERISCDNCLFDIVYDNLLILSLEHTNLEVMLKINTVVQLTLILN
jgi:hypothetical protein